jgi:ankyrin repeat protein
MVRVTVPLMMLLALSGCGPSPQVLQRPVSANPGLTNAPVAADASESLVAAVRSGNKVLVAAHLANGEAPNSTAVTDKLHGDVRDSLLSIAIAEKQYAIARLLLDEKADPNGVRGEHQFPLWWAARSGNMGITTELVSRGADLDIQREGNGTTALHIAIYFDHPQVVRYLVERGADIEKRTQDLNPWGIRQATPLELARNLGHLECERALAGKE